MATSLLVSADKNKEPFEELPDISESAPVSESVNLSFGEVSVIVISPLEIVPKELLPKVFELPDAVILADRLNDVPETAEVKVVPPRLLELLVLVIAAEDVKPSTTATPVTSIPVLVVFNFALP